MNKKNLSEDDTSAKFITPALYKAGWDEAAIRRQVAFTAGRIIVRGKLVTRGKAKRADYVLYYQHFPIALIEAKHNFNMQQALDYATTLDIPFVFSSNGHGFVLHDRTGTVAQKETTLALDAFPSPADLWSRYLAWKGLTPSQEQVAKQPYFDDGSGKEPRYYQHNAVNAAVEAIAKGQNRVLLVMATGTGKACATSHERLDGNNGLLLAPHADHLFDRGFISFDAEGMLMLSSSLDKEDFTRLGLPSSLSCTFNEEQKGYLKFHREMIFLD